MFMRGRWVEIFTNKEEKRKEPKRMTERETKGQRGGGRERQTHAHSHKQIERVSKRHRKGQIDT